MKLVENKKEFYEFLTLNQLACLIYVECFVGLNVGEQKHADISLIGNLEERVKFGNYLKSHPQRSKIDSIANDLAKYDSKARIGAVLISKE